MCCCRSRWEPLAWPFEVDMAALEFVIFTSFQGPLLHTEVLSPVTFNSFLSPSLVDGLLLGVQ